MGVFPDILVYAMLGVKLSLLYAKQVLCQVRFILTADGTLLSCHEILLMEVST